MKVRVGETTDHHLHHHHHHPPRFTGIGDGVSSTRVLGYTVLRASRGAFAGLHPKVALLHLLEVGLVYLI